MKSKKIFDINNSFFVILTFLSFICFFHILILDAKAYHERGLVITAPNASGTLNVLGYKIQYYKMLDCPPPILWCFQDYAGEKWSYSMLDKEQFLGKYMVHAKKVIMNRPELKDRFNVFDQHDPSINKHPVFYVTQHLNRQIASGYYDSFQAINDAIAFQDEPIFLRNREYLTLVVNLVVKTRQGITNPYLLQAIEKTLPDSCDKRIALALSYNLLESPDLEIKIKNNLYAMSCKDVSDLFNLSEILSLSVKHYKSMLDTSIDDANIFQAKLFEMVDKVTSADKNFFKNDFRQMTWAYREIATIRELMLKNNISSAGDHLHKFFISNKGQDKKLDERAMELSWQLIERAIDDGKIDPAINAINNVFTRIEYIDENTKRLTKIVKKQVNSGSIPVAIDLLKVSQKVVGDRCNLCNYSITIVDIMINKGLKEEGCESLMIQKAEEILSQMKCKDEEALAKYIRWSELFGENSCPRQQKEFKTKAEKGGRI